MFLSTPHSSDAIDFLESLVPAYKVGSGDLTNLPFLKKIAKRNRGLRPEAGFYSGSIPRVLAGNKDI